MQVVSERGKIKEEDEEEVKSIRGVLTGEGRTWEDKET